MLMVAAMFTNRPIYDSIRTCDVGLSQRGPCPVAKKPILEDRESDQSVAYFVSANFGLVIPGPGRTRGRIPSGATTCAISAKINTANCLKILVGARGFEQENSWSGKRS